jgi:hypothetical protein
VVRYRGLEELRRTWHAAPDSTGHRARINSAR